MIIDHRFLHFARYWLPATGLVLDGSSPLPGAGYRLPDQFFTIPPLPTAGPAGWPGPPPPAQPGPVFWSTGSARRPELGGGTLRAFRQASPGWYRGRTGVVEEAKNRAKHGQNSLWKSLPECIKNQARESLNTR